VNDDHWLPRYVVLFAATVNIIILFARKSPPFETRFSEPNSLNIAVAWATPHALGTN